MRARVLWVVKGLGPGGAERLLCAQARAQDRSRFDTTCAFVLPWKDHLAEELERAGVTTVCLSRRRRDMWWPRETLRLIRNGKWDIVHIHSPLPGSMARVAVRMIPRSRRPIVVTTEHNQWSTFQWVTRTLNAFTCQGDDATLAVSDEVRESLRGRAKRRARALRHGIDVDDVARHTIFRDAIRSELGVRPDEILVGTVANFRPQKDYPNLLASVRLLADRGVSVRVVAVGQGPDEEAVRAESERLGLESRMIFTGFREDATAVMGACDAFVLASRWEGLPVAVMEATALGLPIVATSVGGIAEEFTSGVDALLVPPQDSSALADALQTVSTDPQLRQSLSEAVRALSRRFDVRRSTREIEGLYEVLLKDRKSVADEPILVPQDSDVSNAPAVQGSSGSRSLGLDVRMATPEDGPGILELCRSNLGWGDDPRFHDLFRWKHELNPFGPSLMMVAVDADRIVGFRAFMNWRFERGDRVLRAVRAVDTVTHADYQGRGIFSLLTRAALEQLRKDEVDFVFNTPNDLSRPGYLKMGWRDVGRLPISVRFVGPLGIRRIPSLREPASHWPVPKEIGVSASEVVEEIERAHRSVPRVNATDRRLRTQVSDEFVRWRYTQAFLDYRAVLVESGVVVLQFRQRGNGLECLIVDSFAVSPRDRDLVATEMARRARADYVVRSGPARPSAAFLPAVGRGPRLTWRSVESQAMPPLSNWDLTMGTIALF